jgi:hypothetical protein
MTKSEVPEDLEVQIEHLTAALLEAQDERDEYRTKHSDAICNLTLLVKENKIARLEIQGLTDHIVCLEREASKLENRLLHAETCLKQYVKATKERRATSLPLETSVYERGWKEQYRSLESEHEAQRQVLATASMRLQALETQFHELSRALAMKEMQLQRVEGEQKEERELIAIMRETLLLWDACQNRDIRQCLERSQSVLAKILPTRCTTWISYFCDKK